MLILVINSGSSSIKFQLFHRTSRNPELIAKGMADAIGLSNSRLLVEHGTSKTNKKTPLLNHKSSLKKIFQELTKQKIIKSPDDITITGHRVVHGGEKYKKPIKITPQVIKHLKELIPLAPLHNPANITCIEACTKIFPKAKHIAVFDTSFHQTMPDLAYLYAVPPELYLKHGIRRYGFHGINHQYVNNVARKLLVEKKRNNGKIITIHLGNGCSMTAIKNGKSIENSMGYTPLEGLPMGTRSGDIDPALAAILGRKLKKTADEVTDYLNNNCGLKGMSGLSSDMRTVWAAVQKKSPRAIKTLDIYCYRVAKYLNAYVRLLGGIDAIVFTGGIGENAWYAREKILQYTRHLKIFPNSLTNKKNATFFQERNSACALMIIPANEELEIAKQTGKLV